MADPTVKAVAFAMFITTTYSEGHVYEPLNFSNQSISGQLSLKLHPIYMRFMLLSTVHFLSNEHILLQ